MEGKTTGARDMVRVCLAFAAAYLLIELLLRSSLTPSQRGAVTAFVLPFALGLVTGVLAGPRWQDPVRASVLLAAALAVADIIPFTIDTMALANLSDERIVSMVRERLDAKIFAMIPPAELRVGPAKIRAQAVEVWILLWPLRLGISGGLTVLGALVGRRLGRGRQRVAPSDAVGGASA